MRGEMVSVRSRLIAAMASVTCHGLSGLIFSAAATPGWCLTNCRHAELLSTTVVTLQFFHGASGGRDWPAVGDTASARPAYNGEPYVVPARGAACRVGCSVNALADTVPPCPGRSHGPSPRLLVAPKPLGLPRSTAEEPDAVVACVRVAREGHVERAYLTRGAGDQALDRRLLEQIETEWMFAPALGGARPTATWASIRINPDRPEPSSSLAYLAFHTR